MAAKHGRPTFNRFELKQFVEGQLRCVHDVVATTQINKSRLPNSPNPAAGLEFQYRVAPLHRLYRH